MKDFDINDEKLDFIANAFNLKRENLDILLKSYRELKLRNETQYLAHVMRSLEQFVRETLEKPFFKISCKPSSKNESIKGCGCASYTKGISFVILYDSSLSPKDARVVIAHELGHLFWSIISDTDFKNKHEPLSSVFGIFTILEKNDFYENKSKIYMHDSWQEVVADFSKLKNKTEGKFNLS